jgi:hypothetical protein
MHGGNIQGCPHSMRQAAPVLTCSPEASIMGSAAADLEYAAANLGHAAETGTRPLWQHPGLEGAGFRLFSSPVASRHVPTWRRCPSPSETRSVHAPFQSIPHPPLPTPESHFLPSFPSISGHPSLSSPSIHHPHPISHCQWHSHSAPILCTLLDSSHRGNGMGSGRTRHFSFPAFRIDCLAMGRVEHSANQHG